MSITLLLIIVTCIISFLCFSNEELFNKLAHYPYAEKNSGEKYRWLTSGFVHLDYFHLLINMFVLYNFGPIVEHMFKNIIPNNLGSTVYLIFYLFMIVIANLPTFKKHCDNPGYRAIGASGTVAAVLFSYIVFRPTSMLSLYFFIPIPAVVFGILYLWYESWAAKKQMDNIGHDTHFYGAIAGFLFTVAIKPSLILDFFSQIMNVF